MSHNNKLMQKCAVGYLYIQLLWATLFYPIYYIIYCIVVFPFFLFGKRVAKNAMLYFREVSTFKYTFFFHKGHLWNLLEISFTIATVLFPLLSLILILFFGRFKDLELETAILVYVFLIIIIVFFFDINIDNYIRKNNTDCLVYNEPLKDKVFIVIVEFIALVIIGVIDYHCIVYLLNM
jgi:hypothetical protein